MSWLVPTVAGVAGAKRRTGESQETASAVSIDEDFAVWGSEIWDAEKGRLGGPQFNETDFDDKLRAGS
jgi:hypothetical protein